MLSDEGFFSNTTFFREMNIHFRSLKMMINTTLLMLDINNMQEITFVAMIHGNRGKIIFVIIMLSKTLIPLNS